MYMKGVYEQSAMYTELAQNKMVTKGRMKIHVGNPSFNLKMYMKGVYEQSAMYTELAQNKMDYYELQRIAQDYQRSVKDFLEIESITSNFSRKDYVEQQSILLTVWKRCWCL
ncbi:unnamed protein product [Rotaria magnacalcarata]|uniref:Uncharacterized protein n=1 Tax=Rotaria magnacalcarata TaxID=392030 RepID=A0A816ALE5_9BILA|nr:unnamed protein product [Rotaria magnacalcarata]